MRYQLRLGQGRSQIQQERKRMACANSRWRPVPPNDVVERRGAWMTTNEDALSQSSIPSLTHRRRNPRSVEPIDKRDLQRRSIKVLPCSRAVKVADPTARYHGRCKVVGIDATGVEKAILPVRVVGYAATVGASIIKAHAFIPGIAHQATSRRFDSNGGRPEVGPQGSISAADGAIADSEGARKAADMNSNSAAVAQGSWEGGLRHGATVLIREIDAGMRGPHRLQHLNDQNVKHLANRSTIPSIFLIA